MKPPVIIGVDPGMDGAIAALVGGELFDVYDMPTRTNVVRSKGKKRNIRSIDSEATSALLKEIHEAHSPILSTPLLAIESVGARPGEAAGSSFRFGECFGTFPALAAAEGWVLAVVRSQVWKPAVGLPVGSDKGDSLDLARALYPTHAAGTFKRKKDHGRADAALIARWAWEVAE